MENVIRIKKGSVEEVLECYLAESDEYEFILFVGMTKKDIVVTDWSFIPKGIVALGCVDILKKRLMENLP